jgi:hypothetical protein
MEIVQPGAAIATSRRRAGAIERLVEELTSCHREGDGCGLGSAGHGALARA